MEKTFAKGKVNECCLDLNNREKQPSNKPELIIQKCKTCGRSHYRLMAEPAFFGLVQHGLGRK